MNNNQKKFVEIFCDITDENGVKLNVNELEWCHVKPYISQDAIDNWDIYLKEKDIEKLFPKLKSIRDIEKSELFFNHLPTEQIGIVLNDYKKVMYKIEEILESTFDRMRPFCTNGDYGVLLQFMSRQIMFEIFSKRVNDKNLTSATRSTYYSVIKIFNETKKELEIVLNNFNKRGDKDGLYIKCDVKKPKAGGEDIYEEDALFERIIVIDDSMISREGNKPPTDEDLNMIFSILPEKEEYLGEN